MVLAGVEVEAKRQTRVERVVHGGAAGFVNTARHTAVSDASRVVDDERSGQLSQAVLLRKVDDVASLGHEVLANVLAFGFGALLMFLLPVFESSFLADVVFSALIGGGLGSYFALRKDGTGEVTRDIVGKSANKAAVGTYTTALELEKEYQLTDKAKKFAKEDAPKLAEKAKEELPKILADLQKLAKDK